MSKRVSRLTVFALLGVFGCQGVGAQQNVLPRNPTSPTARYVAGELIVKLKPETGETLDAALHTGKPPIDTGLSWFDALSRQYGVTAIEPLFANQPSLEEIQRKYPARARRAPPGATAPSLKYLYKLTMRRHVDIEQAAFEYGHHPNVEYAQPNYLATIQ